MLLPWRSRYPGGLGGGRGRGGAAVVASGVGKNRAPTSPHVPSPQEPNVLCISAVYIQK